MTERKDAWPLAGERARASRMGIRVNIDHNDRPGPDMEPVTDTRGQFACPRCEDGVRTIAFPAICEACTRETGW